MEGICSENQMGNFEKLWKKQPGIKKMNKALQN